MIVKVEIPNVFVGATKYLVYDKDGTVEATIDLGENPWFDLLIKKTPYRYFYAEIVDGVLDIQADPLPPAGACDW